LQAAVIVMVIVTTFVAPPLLRVAFNQGDAGKGDELVPEVAAAD
jgi:hypothetical protein